MAWTRMRCNWMVLQVDEIPLSRPKRNIARDFSDGGDTSVACGPCLHEFDQWPCTHAPTICTQTIDLTTSLPPFRPAVLFAEVVSHFFPKLVDLHNYRCLHNSLGSHPKLQALTSAKSERKISCLLCKKQNHHSTVVLWHVMMLPPVFLCRAMAKGLLVSHHHLLVA